MKSSDSFTCKQLSPLINDITTTTVVKNYRVGTALLKKDALYRD